MQAALKIRERVFTQAALESHDPLFLFTGSLSTLSGMHDGDDAGPLVTVEDAAKGHSSEPRLLE